MLRLQLQATDSRYATLDELAAANLTPEQIPNNGQLMAHQAATVRALRSGTAPIIINTAMTGDGKTLAGRLPLLNDRQQRTLTMYPTNELARDQAASFDDQLQKWQPPVWQGKTPARRVINAEELDKFQTSAGDLPRQEVLRHLLRQDAILTNPDIFHYIMSFEYQAQGTAPDLLIGELTQRFTLFVFDEFHLFGVAQTASVMIAMLLILRTANLQRPPRFLFLSATPQKMLVSMANRLGLETEQVGSTDYEHGQDQVPEGYRRILQPVDLNLYSGQLETWIEAHTEAVILAFFAENRLAATGLVIANSVATAHRVYAYLKPICAAKGIRVGLNTGATPVEERSRDTGDYDLIIATSTVDVGVDFRINLLIFETPDAATHTQRLGRLGRHKQNARQQYFTTFAAHALVPPWVIEGMTQKFPSGVVNRNAYREALEELLPPLQQFEPYIYRWAGVQAGKVLRELSKYVIRTQYEGVWESLSADYPKLFGKSVKKYIALVKQEQHETLDAASTFRGVSAFSALLLNKESNNNQIIAYNLITILLRGDVEAVPVDEMLSRAEQQGQSAYPLKRGNPLAAYILRGWLPEARRIEITLNHALEANEWETVVEKQGFRFARMDVDGLLTLNDTLEIRTLVTLCIRDKTPDMVRRRLRLGYFELFAFRDLSGATGTAAFGRDALLLDSILFRMKQSADALYW